MHMGNLSAPNVGRLIAKRVHMRRDLTLTHIDAIISAKDGGEVKVGDKATFTVEAFPNRPFSGAVTQIRPSPQALDHAATYDVVISAPNPDFLLEPGMAATIRIVIE